MDKPRIVQVGYNAAFLQQLRQRMGLTRLVNQLVSEGSVIAIRVLDKNMITVDYAERLRDDKLPEPDGERSGEPSQVGERRANRKPSGRVAPQSGGSDRRGGGRAKRWGDPGDSAYRSYEGRYSQRDSAGYGCQRPCAFVRVSDWRFRRQEHLQADCRFDRYDRRIAGGDFTQRIDIRAKNEIGVLAASFNGMTRRLAESIEHLKETTAAKERIESELKIAHEIQMSMVPKIFPAFPERSEFDIFAALVPAKEVGGDLYDFFFIDDDQLCFAVADVSGKGVPASLFMAVTRPCSDRPPAKAAILVKSSRA